MMRRIILSIYISLDGVVEEPAWTMPYWSDDLAKYQDEQFWACDTLLLGRVTYEGFAEAWPTMTDEDGFADRMNSMPKYVASRTLKETKWNAILLEGDVAEAVQKLKEEPGDDLLIYGSGGLVKTLMQANLIDEYRLWVYPLVLGKGRTLFNEGDNIKLKLVNSVTMDTGVIVLCYRPADDEETEQHTG